MTPSLSRRSLLATGLAATAVSASGLGSTSALASTSAAPSTTCRPSRCPDADVHRPLRQFRGLWIASVANTDWPSKPGLTAAQQQQELTALFDLAVADRMNAVVLQVRPTSDAFFRSTVEPWSKYLTGTQGQDPGYDPLAFACTEAHARGLELHAWFNPFRVTMNLADLAGLTADHPAKLHPEWTVTYGGKVYWNPGVPEARQHCIDAIMQAVAGYDVDAVHFDDYFYPYKVAGQVFDDAAQFAQYGNGMTLDDWRRDNINRFVLGVRAAIRRTRRPIKLGISPFGVWMNQANDPRGSATTAGSQTYSDLYADTRRWVQEEWIDYIAPQVYWANSLAVASYGVLVKWWADVAKDSRTQLYIGEATYKVNASTQSPEWNGDPNELSNHLQIDASTGGVDGNIWYNATAVRLNPLNAMGIVRDTWYSRPALVPAMPWLGSRHDRPRPVRALEARRRDDGVHLTLEHHDERTWQYAIERVAASDHRHDDVPCDARDLVALVVATGRRQQWVDTTADAHTDYTYVVTAVDRRWNESEARRVRVR